jgi:hypothetical protein
MTVAFALAKPKFTGRGPRDGFHRAVDGDTTTGAREQRIAQSVQLKSVAVYLESA